jgi:hypothetical protein
MAWEQRQQEAEAAAHAKALQHEHAARAAAEEAAAAAAARAGGELDALRAQLTSAAAQSEAALRVRLINVSVSAPGCSQHGCDHSRQLDSARMVSCSGGSKEATGPHGAQRRTGARTWPGCTANPSPR